MPEKDNSNDIAKAYERKDYGWYIAFIMIIVIATRFGGAIGAACSVVVISLLYSTVKNENYSKNKKLVLSTVYLVGGLIVTGAIYLSIAEVIYHYWPQAIPSNKLAPASDQSVNSINTETASTSTAVDTETTNPPSPTNTTSPSIKVATTTHSAPTVSSASGYKSYQNQTMYIASLLHPSDWTATTEADQLGFTLEAPDHHVDVTGILYAGDTSTDLQTIFTEVQQGTQQNNIQITNHEIRNINNADWLIYDYETHAANQTYDNRAAIMVFAQNDRRQFTKLQLESNAGYFDTDAVTFDKILSSIKFTQ
jgi:hypothetical protein